MRVGNFRCSAQNTLISFTLKYTYGRYIHILTDFLFLRKEDSEASMKRILLIIFLLHLGGIKQLIGQTNRKVALLIGISHYPPASGWQSIHAENDLKVIQEALLIQGFSPDQIKILRNQDATKEGIKRTIKSHFSSLRPGDFAYLHFSGHGQQVPDQNGDELDQLDEALVPFDALESYEKNGYQGENHLLDDELALWLAPIRKRLGSKGQLLITLDACHSGTATRDGADLPPARGSKIIMAADQTFKRKPENNFLANDTDLSDADLAPIFLFTATSQKGLNYEVKPNGQELYYGPLSYAFSKTFPGVKEKITYEDFYDQLLKELSIFHMNQSPSAEGPMHHFVFQGKLNGKPGHYKVLHQNKKYVRINAGSFAGVLPNTKIGFYPPNTFVPQPEKNIYSGIVTNSQLLYSDILLNETAPDNLDNTWAFIEYLNLGDLKVTIKLDVDNKQLREQLQEKLSVVSNFIEVQKNADIIIQQKGVQELQIYTAKDQQLTTKNIAHLSFKEQAQQILDKVLLPYAQAAYLRQFQFQDRFVDLKMEILPQVVIDNIEHQKTKYKTIDISTKRQANGKLVFTSGDKIKLKVSNLGKKAFYFSIFDIQPDNKVNLLIPGKHRSVEEYYLKPGETLVLPHRWTLSAPYGQELFKLIALDQPINILQPYTRGENIKLPPPPFKGNARGEVNNNNNYPPNSAHVTSLVFFIQAKQNAQ